MIKYKICKDIYDFIEIETDYLNISLCSFGASIYRLKAFNHDFMLSPDDKKAFLYSKGYYGKTLGPIAGRYESKQYYPNKNNQIILHGGENGLSFKNFSYTIHCSNQSIKVVFTKMLDKPDEFVGNHAIYQVSYIINDQSEEILILHEITALKDTYASLSLHSYFRLKEKNILNTELQLKASKVSLVNEDYLIYDWNNITTGYNFSDLRLLKSELGQTSDIYKRGHHFKDVTYPVIIKDNDFSIKIESDYKDTLLTIDQLPCGEICFEEVEQKYAAYVIEPELNAFSKKCLFIKQGETRINFIKINLIKN